MFTGAHSHTHAMIASLRITLRIIYSYCFLGHVASQSSLRLLAQLSLLCAGFIAIFQYESPDRTYRNTIVADMAARLSYRFVFKGSDYSIEASMSETQSPYAEALPAHPHTPATKYTLVRVVYESRAARIYGIIMQKLPESLGVNLDAQMRAELLQFA